MQYKIELINQGDIKWHSIEGIYVKGYACTAEGEKLSYERFAKYLESELKHKDLADIVRTLNGIFSIVYHNDGQLTLFSDASRFYTLFYFKSDHEIIVSDSAHYLLSKIEQPALNLQAVNEFKGFGFTLNNTTLINTIKQVQGSELINFTSDSISSALLFRYATDTFSSKPREQNLKIAGEIIRETFKRTINVDSDTVYCIPLSGGYDSRLIAVMLKELGVKNIICFTFGKQGKEVKISEEVATQLGFPWFFIEHNNENIVKYLPKGDVLLKHIQYSANLSSMFYMNEIIAAHFLKENILPTDKKIVFLPGHCGDVLGGSQYIKTYAPEISQKQISRQIILSIYIYSSLGKTVSEKLITAINSVVTSLYNKTDDARSVIDDWDLREKHAKMNVNSSKVYAQMGYEVRFPFWDKELMLFFSKLPFSEKEGKQFYNELLINHFFKPKSVSFIREIEPSLHKIKFQNFKNYLKKILGLSTTKKSMLKTDWVNYHDILKKAEIEPKSLSDPKVKNNLNAHMIHWYLDEIKKSVHNK